MSKGPISTFLMANFKHFNAAALIDAAQGYEQKLSEGNKMLVSLAGAMSTAELGISLAEMIRADKIHAVSCTGANLEEDVFNLVAHNHYKRIPKYRDLNPEGEQELLENHYNRVTDTCIPEMEAIRVIEKHLVRRWVDAANQEIRLFPHEFFYDLLLSEDISSSYQINPKHSWVLAAAEKNLPIVVPGWEDSTCGNFFASYCIKSRTNPQIVKSGTEYMIELAKWYQKESKTGIGFFQIGGGIAGDFPICVVPMIKQDLRVSVPLWSYFCQISDSTTSYGSYSGAIPSEKITWGKLGIDTPKFVIESDATIVAPLIFAYLLNK